MALATVAVILALVVLGMFLLNIATRECQSNRDCSDSAYCGTDYECHGYPQQAIRSSGASLLTPAFIFGGSIIIAAYIFKNGNQSK